MASIEVWNEIFRDDLSEDLQELLDNGEDPNQRLHMTSPLGAAVHHGAIGCVKVLLENGADINFGGRGGLLPLLMAVKGTKPVHMTIFRYLLERGSKLDIKYVNGNTPLLEAIMLPKRSESAYLEKAMALIKAGADINIRNNAGDSGLHLAAIRGRIHIVDKLLELGMDPNISQKRGLRTKIETGITPLHLTATVPSTVFDNSHVAVMLINSGANVNSRKPGGPTPLHFAAYYGANTVAELLLARGCEVDPICTEHEAAESSSIWRTPLSLAVHRDHLLMVNMLCEWGADVDMPDQNGNTALVYAALSRKEDVSRALVRAGGNVNATRPGGTSVLYGLLESIHGTSEVDRGKVNIACILVKAGAKVGVLEEALLRQVIETFEAATCSDLIQRTIIELEDLLSYGKLSPLKQLARLCIRHHLKYSGLRPDVVYSLPLPTKLQECLAFCDL